MARIPKVIGTCSRCPRLCRKDDGDFTAWNGTFSRGVLVTLICPACQTEEENAEAVVNEATLDYRQRADGRSFGIPRTG